MDTKWVDWSKTSRSKDYQGSHSFSTFMIIGPVCFFLGILFASFPYDFPLLWTKAPVPPEYYDQLVTHLKFVYNSPPLIARVLQIIAGVGFTGFFIKLFKPSEANVLFDGASLVLYVISGGIFIANTLKALREVEDDIWGADGQTTIPHDGPFTGEKRLTRAESLRVMSASNTILALVLAGILVLQAGQWYAERKEADDYAKLEQEEAEAKKTSAAAGGGSKKKQ